MTDTAEQAEAPVTRRDLAEGRIERVLSDRTAMVTTSVHVGGLKIDDMLKAAEAAKLMATAGPFLPPWLQGNIGGCWSLLIYSAAFGIDPLTLARWTYQVENKGVKQVAFLSAFYTAIVTLSGVTTTRLQVRYEGEGDKRKCFVFATFKGETEPREWPPKDSGDEFTLGKLRPKLNESGQVRGSPLWLTRPDVQLYYSMSRDWCRIYCSDLVGGFPARDDLPDAKDLTELPYTAAPDVSPSLAKRLRGPGGDGFQNGRIAEHIDATIDAARDPETKSAEQRTPPRATSGEGPGESSGVAVGGTDAATVALPPAASVPSQSGGSSSDLPLQGGDGDGPDGAAVGTAPTTGPTAADQQPAEDPELAEARDKGRAAFAAGAKRGAVPTEWRDKAHTAQARAWMDGWQEAYDAKKRGG